MKYLLTVLLSAFILLQGSKAQTAAIDTIYVVDTLARDTVPMFLPVMDTSVYYDVYNSNNRVVKRNADVHYIVPVGGKRIETGFINNNIQILKVYVVFKTNLDHSMETVEILNWRKKPFIRGSYVDIGTPIHGGYYR